MPQEPTVLLEEALEKTTPRAAVKPDGDFINRLPKLGLEDEEQRSEVVIRVNLH